ncbi:MAG: DUF4340 domain-containing protein [Gammaproteobacteria bacterium]|nr:DUF4340 domain-containing protein [Gammaproteobacteria bacterium]MDE2346273.1 DUF4340 domain-containing protein [Gammaproteobacteria bacterium]
MKNRWLLNLVLLVVIAGLGAFLYLKPGIHKPKPAAKLTTLKAADITQIKIQRGSAAAAQLVRTPEGWEMRAPLKLRADQTMVKTLLDSLQEEVLGSFSAAQPNLAQYGLKPASAKLWLNNTELEFGGTEPIHNHRYVKIGNTIYLTGSLLYFRVNHTPLWWASKRLLPQHAHIIGLQLPDASLTLKGVKWQLSPANPDISSDAIQSLIGNWENAQAISTNTIGKGKPEGEVAVELAGVRQPLRFAILKDPDFLVLARPDLGLEYQLESGQRGSLLVLKPGKAAHPKTNKSPVPRPHKPASHPGR